MRRRRCSGHELLSQVHAGRPLKSPIVSERLIGVFNLFSRLQAELGRTARERQLPPIAEVGEPPSGRSARTERRKVASAQSGQPRRRIRCQKAVPQCHLPGSRKPPMQSGDWPDPHILVLILPSWIRRRAP
jgi:hypothetical protein